MPRAAGADATKVFAQTLDRGLQILELVAHAPDAVTLSQAAAAIDVHRTVAYRLAATLVTRGYLRREESGGYRLGSTCLALAAAVSDLRSLARPLLEDLAKTTNETVHLVVVSGQDVVFIDGIESDQALRVASRTGRRLPAHATSVGKAWLAALDADRLHQIYPNEELPQITARTLDTRADLERVLATVRRLGHATSNGESESGVGSIGVAICDRAGTPRAAISVAMPLGRFTPEARRVATEALSTTAEGLALRLA